MTQSQSNYITAQLLKLCPVSTDKAQFIGPPRAGFFSLT